MAATTNMFPAAAAVISGINLLNIFTNVILQDYRPKKQPGRSTSPRKRSIKEKYACATRSRPPGVRFHTGKSRSFPFEFSRLNEIFQPVKQPAGVNSRLYESLQHDIFGGVMQTNT